MSARAISVLAISLLAWLALLVAVATLTGVGVASTTGAFSVFVSGIATSLATGMGAAIGGTIIAWDDPNPVSRARRLGRYGAWLGATAMVVATVLLAVAWGRLALGA